MIDVVRWVPGESDWTLLNWYTRMDHDGELEHTLSRSVRSPSAFLNFFAQRALFYRLGTFEDITHAAWFELSMGSAFLSYYVSPGYRSHQKENCFFLYDMIDMAMRDGVQEGSE